MTSSPYFPLLLQAAQLCNNINNNPPHPEQSQTTTLHYNDLCFITSFSLFGKETTAAYISCVFFFLWRGVTVIQKMGRHDRSKKREGAIKAKKKNGGQD
jgi:hypothetical protein